VVSLGMTSTGSGMHEPSFRESRLPTRLQAKHTWTLTEDTVAHQPPCAASMSTYTLQTKTMLHSISDTPNQLLRLAAKRDEPKAQLPSKRKRDSLCGLGAFTKPFTIRTHPESPYDKPATFKPVRVIGRSQLPLTFLDTSSDEHFAPNSLFAAHIEILEDGEPEYNIEESGSLRVLIARFETKRTLYAIERVQPRVYSICRLASWLKEKDVADLWDPANVQVLATRPKQKTDTVTQGEWWQHAVVETQPVEFPVKRARMRMMRPKPQPQITAVLPRQPEMTSDSGDARTLNTIPAELPLELPADLPSPQEQLNLLIHQYLDAVYMSKTSLAYFAKGPITRIRNAFTSSDEGAPPTHELVAFLRTMLLSPKASEKKYYDKLPSLIKALPPGSYSDDEATAGASKAKKSKKKAKLSREGVYPQEEFVIRKWWQSELPNGDNMATETIEQRIRRRIGDLRVRETLAQLIVMLEIVALEALSTSKASVEQPLTIDETQTQVESQTVPKKRKKKLDDIHLQLDLLLDKLSIWHVTEEVGILDFDTKPSRQKDGSDGFGRNGSNDRLHSFCVEVIVPFYINRLPEQALMVNKKLGGPTHSLPSKRKAMKPPITSRKSGESKEPEAKKSRRSLARVATDNTGRTVERTTPSLSRSATDSALLNGIKREGSEVPLSAIPFQRSPSTKSARQSMSQIRHLQGRQIDLAQPSAAAAAKLKHKQRVEEDLQEAISALKKPNRGLAAGGYVATNEQRGLGLPSKSKKPTVRKNIKDVQVSATPRVGKRTKNMVEQTPVHHHYHPLVRLSSAKAPPSSDFCIPSSGAKAAAIVPATGHRSSTARNPAQASIAETPSKAPNTKTFSSDRVRRKIFATPSKSAVASPDSRLPAPSHVFETLAKSIRSSPPTNVSFTPPAVVVTPTRTVPVSASEAAPIPFSVPANDDAEPSIYDALGWNDDDDSFM
jgi:DNA replication regulator SLD3